MDILKIKSKLLAYANIQLSKNTTKYFECKNDGNLHRAQWIFLKLSNNTRIRLCLSNNSKYILHEDVINGIHIIDSDENKIIINHVKIEYPLAHAPEQMFFTLYRKCTRGCTFCPLTYNLEHAHHSLDSIFSRIKNNELPKSIGITSACPPNLTTSDIVDEMCFLSAKINDLLDNNVPIGASLSSPNLNDLTKLKTYGISELRLNIETPNPQLAKKIMPNKPLDNIFNSIKNACNIFGAGKVSSNIILGLGETDNDVLFGIEKLASMGAVATLYPFDSINKINTRALTFSRPSDDRIYNLAIKHKELLDKYKLNPLELKNYVLRLCCKSYISW